MTHYGDHESPDQLHDTKEHRSTTRGSQKRQRVNTKQCLGRAVIASRAAAAISSIVSVGSSDNSPSAYTLHAHLFRDSQESQPRKRSNPHLKIKRSSRFNALSNNKKSCKDKQRLAFCRRCLMGGGPDGRWQHHECSELTSASFIARKKRTKINIVYRSIHRQKTSYVIFGSRAISSSIISCYKSDVSFTRAMIKSLRCDFETTWNLQLVVVFYRATSKSKI
jgi:hypothetical protein